MVAFRLYYLRRGRFASLLRGLRTYVQTTSSLTVSLQNKGQNRRRRCNPSAFRLRSTSLVRTLYVVVVFTSYARCIHFVTSIQTFSPFRE